MSSSEEKCEHCKGTGLDPNSYDEHIQSNGFWFARHCEFCVGTGIKGHADSLRNLNFLIFYALHGFRIGRGDTFHFFYGS
jgi:DnaJ-class molecular chaperone